MDTRPCRPIGAALCILLLALAGCASLRGGPEEPAAAARRQAQELTRAQMRRDYERAVDLTYPGSVELAGGRERAMAAARQQWKEVDDAGAKVHSVTVSPATQVITDGGTMYAVLPTRTTWWFQGRSRSDASYLFGISTDGGKSWTFVDGVAMFHPATRRKLFPALPPTLVLPVPEIPGFTAPP